MGFCGCGSDSLCSNCNSNYFIGFDNSNSKPYKNQSAPNTNGNNCTGRSTQNVDVKNKKFIFKGNKFWFENHEENQKLYFLKE